LKDGDAGEGVEGGGDAGDFVNVEVNFVVEVFAGLVADTDGGGFVAGEDKVEEAGVVVEGGGGAAAEAEGVVEGIVGFKVFRVNEAVAGVSVVKLGDGRREGDLHGDEGEAGDVVGAGLEGDGAVGVEGDVGTVLGFGGVEDAAVEAGLHDDVGLGELGVDSVGLGRSGAVVVLVLLGFGAAGGEQEAEDGGEELGEGGEEAHKRMKDEKVSHAGCKARVAWTKAVMRGWW